MSALQARSGMLNQEQNHSSDRGRLIQPLTRQLWNASKDVSHTSDLQIGPETYQDGWPRNSATNLYLFGSFLTGFWIYLSFYSVACGKAVRRTD